MIIKQKQQYVKDKEVVMTPFDYTIEFCTTCDRDMQFDIQTNECVLCGSNAPFGLWDDKTEGEWDDYYEKNRQTVWCCRLVNKK